MRERERREREREGKRDQFVPIIYTFSGWFLYVLWPGIEPTTLEYRDDDISNWAMGPGPFKMEIIMILEL